jgi:hypothetical protein
MADQVNDAGLNDRLRENRIDGFRKALQAIDDGDQDIVECVFRKNWTAISLTKGQ